MRALYVKDIDPSISKNQETDIGLLLGQVRMAIITGTDREFLADEELASLEVTTAQFVILKNVLLGKADSACELCKFMDYDRGAMSRMIDRLEKKGLIRRVPMPHTRKMMALQVTPEGKAAYPKMQAYLTRVINRLLKGVTKKEIRELEGVLKRMLANG